MKEALIFFKISSIQDYCLDIKISIFTNPSARAGYDSRSIFKRSLSGLNSEFSFSLTSCLTKAEELSLPYYLPIAGNFLNHLVTELWSTVPSSFTKKKKCFWLLPRHYSPVRTRIRLSCTFICAAFKSHTDWSSVQSFNAPTTTILQIIAGTLNG